MTSIKINDNIFPLKELNVLSAFIKRKNLSCDELIIQVPNNCNISYNYGDIIELWEGTCRRFKGKIVQVTNEHSHKTNTKKIIVKNAFDELSQIIFQQPVYVIKNNVLSKKFRSKVVLGATSNGSKMSINDTAKEILNYAIAQGADLKIGEIDIDGDLLFDECIDISCANALCKILRWSPTCLLWFDYSGNNTPSINIKKRSSISEINIDAMSGNIKSYWANRRDDLVIDAVEIKYERLNFQDDNTYLDLFEDIYPQEITTTTPIKKKMVMNVELAGYKSTSQQNVIKTQSIREESKQWWKNHVAILAELDDFEILQTSRLGKLSNELVEGTITDSMNLNAEYDTITGEFSYQDEYGSEITKVISIKMATTSASSGTYTDFVPTERAEQAPTGLAKAIYDAVNSLEYDGEIQILNAKAEDYFGKRISIFEKNTKISNPSPTYYVEEDLFSNTLKVKFGPPKHLYPDDISELFRINRSRKLTTLTLKNDTGTISANTVILGGKTANSLSEEISTNYSRLVIGNENKIIDINSNDLQTGESAKFTETYVCINGMLAKAKIITTTPHII